jgi:predicted nucleic acid-binding protein
MIDKSTVLVDSSVWIHYFRRSGGRRAKETLKEALMGGRVATCWVVKAELLVGTRNEANFRKLDDLLRGLTDVPIDASVWHKAAQIGAKLRRRGVTLPLPDLLIAQAAMQAEIELWHADNHFEEIGKIVPLRAKNFAPSDSA